MVTLTLVLLGYSVIGFFTALWWTNVLRDAKNVFPQIMLTWPITLPLGLYVYWILKK